MIISVIGGGDASPDVLALAEEVGRQLGRRGVTVACGGLHGVMEAVCRGAKEAGGTTIGILPGTNPSDANRHVDIPICTGINYARNVIVVHTGRAVIAVDGAYGTLSEIGHALSESIPVIGLKTWTLCREGVMDSRVITSTGPEDAVEKAVAAAKAREHSSP